MDEKLQNYKIQETSKVIHNGKRHKQQILLLYNILEIQNSVLDYKNRPFTNCFVTGSSREF